MSVLYAFDAEGNVAQRTGASSNVLSDHLFDAHGSSLNGSLSEPFGYKAQYGYYPDSETGFQLLTHRYYDPSTGRFITRDPIGYAGGINLYSYVQNDPSNSVDPSGLSAAVWALLALESGLEGAAGAGLGGLAAAASPAAAVAGVGVASFVLALPAGQWVADQPWNPFTHPADPIFPHPDCAPRVLPPVGPITLSVPDVPDKGETCAQEWDRAYEMCLEHQGDWDWRRITPPKMTLHECLVFGQSALRRDAHKLKGTQYGSAKETVG